MPTSYTEIVGALQELYGVPRIEVARSENSDHIEIVPGIVPITYTGPTPIESNSDDHGVFNVNAGIRSGATLTLDRLREAAAVMGRRAGRPPLSFTESANFLMNEAMRSTIRNLEESIYNNMAAFGTSSIKVHAEYENSPIAIVDYRATGPIHFDEEYI